LPQALTPDEAAFFSVLGQRITDAASVYESYVRRAGAIDPAFADGRAVRRAVVIGTAYHPKQLQEGIVAYAALIALRNTGFVDGVRSMPPGFTDRLSQTPDLVLQVPGALAAAADAAGVLRAHGEALIAAGRAITKAAYDIQTQPWSKDPVVDSDAVLAGAKTAALQMRAATVPSKARLLASLVSAPPAPSGGLGAPDVVRGLALAALAITGHTGDGKEAEFEALLYDPAGVQCLNMAKLNLNQCLAVAGPNYEDAYCVGQHAVTDTARCVTVAAGGAGLMQAASLAGPIGGSAAYGPEQASAYGQPLPASTEDDDGPVPQPGPRAYAPDAAQAYAGAPYGQGYAAPNAAGQPQAGPTYPPQTYVQGSYPPGYRQNAPAPNGQPPAAAPQYPQPAYGQPYPAQQYAQSQYAQPAYAHPPNAQVQYSQPQYPQAQYPQAQYPQAQYSQAQAAPSGYPQAPAYPAPQPYAPYGSYAPGYNGR
jgi:hypothetical protein